MTLTKALIVVVLFWFFGQGTAVKCHVCDDNMKNCKKDTDCKSDETICVASYCSKDKKKQPPTKDDFVAESGGCISAQPNPEKKTSYCDETDEQFNFCYNCYCFGDNCNDPNTYPNYAPTAPPSTAPKPGDTTPTPAAGSPTEPGPSTTAPAPSQPAGTAGMNPGMLLVGTMVIAVMVALESE